MRNKNFDSGHTVYIGSAHTHIYILTYPQTDIYIYIHMYCNEKKERREKERWKTDLRIFY